MGRGKRRENGRVESKEKMWRGKERKNGKRKRKKKREEESKEKMGRGKERENGNWKAEKMGENKEKSKWAEERGEKMWRGKERENGKRKAKRNWFVTKEKFQKEEEKNIHNWFSLVYFSNIISIPQLLFCAEI